MAYHFIICEYNPLHSGHIYHINSTKKNNDDKVICIMSGNCVQRGELAIADKYTRASWAIKSGADMVIELPSRYVLAPAQLFALGGIKIISHFKNESSLSFGSECGNIDNLNTLAEILDDEDLNVELKKNLIRGVSYPKALSGAVQCYCIDNNLPDLTDILNNPNNTLGIEYIRALNNIPTKCSPKTILRENNFNDESITGKFASASALRANLDDKELISKYCPNYVMEDLRIINKINDKLFSLLKYNLSTLKSWENIFDLVEGIENRIVEKLNTSNSYEDLIESIKSKRYTLARIKRLLLNGLVNNTHSSLDLNKNDLNFIKVLAVKKSSKNLLSMFDIPVITSSGDYKAYNVEDDNTDIQIDKLYNSICYSYKPNFKIID